MIFIAFFSALMVAFSLYMIANPNGWSRAIVTFSEKAYFHPFEVSSRLLFGMAFIYWAKDTLYPQLFFGIGVVLIMVGIGLLFTPPAKHKEFAVWSAQKFLRWFQLAGVCSLGFGCFLLYAVLAK